MKNSSYRFFSDFVKKALLDGVEQLWVKKMTSTKGKKNLNWGLKFLIKQEMIMQLLILTVFSMICSQSSLYALFYEQPQRESEIYHAEAVNDEAKFYVQPEDIRLSANGIYLDVGGGQSIPIPNVQSDSRGLFTILGYAEQGRYTNYTCPGCGKSYYWWENCVTDGCPYKGN